jgi:hypothetical protein
MTLMNFDEASEQEKVLGPLFATAAKSNVPVFGPDKFQSSKTKTILDTAIKKSLHSQEDPIVDLLESVNLSQTLSDTGILNSQLESKGSNIESSEKASAESGLSNKVYTSREVHDKLHYSTLSLVPSTKSRSELLDHVMLRRAVDGYLFDCKVNKALVSDDPWLQDLWEWIKGQSSPHMKYYMLSIHTGAEEAAQDDGMVSQPLDLSYMGVYTIWMNLLGETPAQIFVLLLKFL